MHANEAKRGHRPALRDGALVLLLAAIALFGDSAFAAPSVIGTWLITGTATATFKGQTVNEELRDTLVFRKNGTFVLGQTGLSGAWTQKGWSVRASIPASAVKATLVKLFRESGLPVKVESVSATTSVLSLTTSTLKGNFSYSARITITGTKIRNAKVTARDTFTGHRAGH